MEDLHIDRQTFDLAVRSLSDWLSDSRGRFSKQALDRFVKTALVDSLGLPGVDSLSPADRKHLEDMVLLSVLAVLATGGGLGIASGLASPRRRREGDAMRGSALSLLFGPLGGIGYGLARRYRAGQEEEGSLAAPKKAASMTKKAGLGGYEYALAKLLLPAITIATLLAPVGGGYLIGRHAPDRPEEVGRNEALYASLLSSFPIIGPLAGLGYSLGRDRAVEAGKKNSKESPS